MDSDLLASLRTCRSDIKDRWTTLLRIEPVHTPLGSPEMMIPTIDATLSAIYTALIERRTPEAEEDVACSCGCNPYLPFYAAGKQALFEALILLQSQTPGMTAERRDQSTQSLLDAVDAVIGDDVAAFGAICQHKQKPEPQAQPVGRGRSPLPWLAATRETPGPHLFRGIRTTGKPRMR